jgi:hypothetical protein
VRATIWLAVHRYQRALVASLLALASCSEPQGAARLPAAPEPYRSTDNTLLIELPASGGHLANGMALQSRDMEAHVRAVFAPRPAEGRAIFVRAAPTRPWEDVEAVSRAAEAAGGHAFDAALSGWREQVPAREPSDSVPRQPN